MSAAIEKSQHPWPQIDGVPSTLIDKMGRIKSDHQTRQDATRQNSYSDIARHTQPDRTNAIIGRRLTQRSQ